MYSFCAFLPRHLVRVRFLVNPLQVFHSVWFIQNKVVSGPLKFSHSFGADASLSRHLPVRTGGPLLTVQYTQMQVVACRKRSIPPQAPVRKIQDRLDALTSILERLAD